MTAAADGADDPDGRGRLANGYSAQLNPRASGSSAPSAATFSCPKKILKRGRRRGDRLKPARESCLGQIHTGQKVAWRQIQR